LDNICSTKALYNISRGQVRPSPLPMPAGAHDVGPYTIGVDLAGIPRWTHGGCVERRRWVGAECGGYGEGCPLSSRLGGLGSVVSSPGGVRKRVLAYFESHRTLFLYLYDKNLRGQFALAPLLQILGGLVPRVPRDLRPCPIHILNFGCGG